MPNFSQVLKAEIIRLSRKEVKATVAPLHVSNIKLKKTIADLKQKISQLAFANDFIRGCDDADWVRLCTLFGEQKRRVAETSDLQSFEPPLMLFKGIEFGDTMVAYLESMHHRIIAVS